MKYAVIIYPGIPRETYGSMSEDEQQAMMNEYLELTVAPGVLGSEQLVPDTATTVRVEDGQTLITDGPFANAKEVIGGFYLLEAKDLDEALEFAKRIPAVRLGGAVEVHAVVAGLLHPAELAER
jgi:hypothetical protein